MYRRADDTGKCMPKITHAHQLSVNLSVKLVGMTQCVNGVWEIGFIKVNKHTHLLYANIEMSVHRK